MVGQCGLVAQAPDQCNGPVKNTLKSDAICRYLGMSYSCCSLLGVLLLSFQTILSSERGHFVPNDGPSFYLESPGKHIPTLLVTLSYIIKHETWGQGKIKIRMHRSRQLFLTPCRVRQTIPSSNEPSFKADIYLASKVSASGSDWLLASWEYLDRRGSKPVT